jgi:hypothetical protein
MREGPSSSVCLNPQKHTPVLLYVRGRPETGLVTVWDPKGYLFYALVTGKHLCLLPFVIILMIWLQESCKMTFIEKDDIAMML